MIEPIGYLYRHKAERVEWKRDENGTQTVKGEEHENIIVIVNWAYEAPILDSLRKA